MELRRIAPNLASRSKTAKHGATLLKAETALKAAIKAYEAKYGVVKID